MRRFLIQRLLALVPVLCVVGTVVFLLVHATPGDPVSYMLGPDASPADVERVRDAMGLNRPVLEQYGLWFANLVRGNLGESIFLRKPVLAAILERLEPTLLLTGLAVLLAVAIGVPAGVIGATHRRAKGGQLVMLFSMFGVSVPSFWLGLNLIMLFGVSLQWLPVAGYAPLAKKGLGALIYLIMPALSLGLIEAAIIARMTRSSMLEVLQQDFVRTARSKGLHERVVIFRHALRNAAIPIVTVIGNTIMVLMGGAVVTETVFNIPGLGRLVIQSVLRRDYPLIQGTVLFVALVYVFINLFVDLYYVWVDPRIRYG